jgi:hypothetical protein
MRHSFAFIIFCLLPLVLIGCSSSTPAFDQTARASLNLSVPSVQTNTSSKEEQSPQIRAAVLEAIQSHMFEVGRFPRQAILGSSILSLHPTNTSYALIDSDWAYKARVRVNLKNHSIRHDFLVFQRGNQYIVRKISL